MHDGGDVETSEDPYWGKGGAKCPGAMGHSWLSNVTLRIKSCEYLTDGKKKPKRKGGRLREAVRKKSAKHPRIDVRSSVPASQVWEVSEKQSRGKERRGERLEGGEGD